MRADQQGIIAILTGIYKEIRAMEVERGLVFGNGDFRPRIEYFHDAVRAFSAGAPAERLRIEMLSYDVRALRWLASHPLSDIAPDAGFSPNTNLIKAKPGSLRQPETEREVKEQLAERYLQYGVLFSALLKPAADKDFRNRKEDKDEEVEELAAVASPGKGAASLLQSAVRIKDLALRNEVIMLLRQGKTREAVAAMKAAVERADRDIRTMDEAHAQYGMTQLALYEEGKEMIKRLAASGMNLAGKFVEAAVADARRGTGRGF